MYKICRYACHELSFQSQYLYENPLWDQELRIELTSPTGRRLTYDGFWDGERRWAARFCLDEVGEWQWWTCCTNRQDYGLHGKTGRLHCVPYLGHNPLYRHGPLRVAPDGFHLEHADGKPFFWLADTAWNGVIRGPDSSWQTYLRARAQQQFNIIQVLIPHWRGDTRDEHGRTACTETHPIRIDPLYFQDKDRRVALINDCGMVVAAVILWSYLPTDLGNALPEEDAIRLARHVVARYGGHHVVWFLGGDGDYALMGFDRWRRIGRSVFNHRHNQLVSLHSSGVHWYNEEFRLESWIDFFGYQSGHGDSCDDLAWHVSGPPSQSWQHFPHKPIINLEPNYEDAFGFQHDTRFTEAHVRRAAYWSCLISPTAGVSFGNDSIWNWNSQPGPSEGHGNWGKGRIEPWSTALHTHGSEAMTLLRRFFESLDWPKLRPSPELLVEQPGHADPRRYIAVAQDPDSSTIVAYTPVGGTIPLTVDTHAVRWFDPRNGQWTPGNSTTTPDHRDWLLVGERRNR